MSTGLDTSIARLKRRGKKKPAVQERYQRPGIKDLGSKWKIAYWDYSSDPRKKRSKVWAKSSVPSRREAQKLADEFMDRVNARNNDPANYPYDGETLSALLARCRQMTWPFLKNSTTKQYGFFFDTYIEPQWGRTKLRKMTTMALQDWFNSFHPRLSQKTIKSITAHCAAPLTKESSGACWSATRRSESSCHARRAASLR